MVSLCDCQWKDSVGLASSCFWQKCITANSVHLNYRQKIKFQQGCALVAFQIYQRFKVHEEVNR